MTVITHGLNGVLEDLPVSGPDAVCVRESKSERERERAREGE